MKYIVIVTFLFILNACNNAKEKYVRNSVNYEQFLSKQNLAFDSLSNIWHEGAFIGNGLLGAVLYKENDHSLRMDISRTDVVDHRPQYILQYGKFRLPIGKFLLSTNSKIKSVDLIQDLWNAEISGSIITERDSLHLQIICHTNKDIFIIRHSKGNMDSLNIEFLPELSVSPRYNYQNEWTGYAPEGYQPNPKPDQ